MNKIIILDDMPYVRYRVKDTMESAGIEIYESSSSFDFFKKLSDNKDDIGLIILEIGLVKEDGFEVLRKIKARKLKIPIMILTKLNTRSMFIKCIKEGALEYILKPFNSKTLIHKTKQLMSTYENNNDSEEIVYLNFQDYINKQIDIAKLKNKKLSLMMLSLIKINARESEEKIEVKDSYLALLDVLYENMKNFFKKPELFEKYGISTFISVLPDCDEDIVVEKSSKIMDYYKNIKANDSRYLKYKLVTSSVTFPEDGTDKNQLLDKLSLEMKHKIN